MKVRPEKRINYVDQIFGRLVVVDQRRDFSHGYGVTILTAKCDCGVVKEYRACNLKTGHTQSCGCFHQEVRTSHGMGYSKLYKVWAAIIQRCTNPNHKQYKRYGGRGITVCKEWLKFASFYADMGDMPKNKELDRIDNNKGYYKENCHWISHLENSKNRVDSKYWFIGSKCFDNVTDASSFFGVSSSTICRWCLGFFKGGVQVRPPKFGCYSKLKYEVVNDIEGREKT